jgi:CPA2 family monovalent cation:H+ antiporter-2
MHDVGLLLTLTIALSAALFFGYVTQRLKQSPLVGYLLAGVLIGPFTPGIVASTNLAQELADVGVILLMFGVGLQFHVEDLVKTRSVAVPGAVSRMIVATALGALVGRALGWSLEASIILGIAVSVSSTVVVLRELSDNDILQTTAGRTMVGWLVVEDLLTVIVVVIVPALADRSHGLIRPIAMALFEMAVLIVLVGIVGARTIPRILTRVAKTSSRELFTLTILVLALGIAVGSAEIFGTSVALGAFLAGLAVGRSEFAARAAADALPMRDAFAVLFFVSIGMLFDPKQLLPNIGLVLAILAIVLVARPLVSFVVMRVLKQPPRTTAVAVFGLAQIGEFSFILASLGKSTGLLPDTAVQEIVASAIVTITLSPLVFRLVDPLVRRLERSMAPAPEAPSLSNHAIVVGYGPVGQTVVRLLGENAIESIVIEMNLDTVRKLRSEGRSVIYGDARQREILEHAGIRRAQSLIFAASGTPPEEVIRAAKELNPSLRTLARSSYVRETHGARHAGAEIVVTAEVEVALAMTEHLLRTLGATNDQLDRARERARVEFHQVTTPVGLR